jgi:hypothetical protein
VGRYTGSAPHLPEPFAGKDVWDYGGVRRRPAGRAGGTEYPSLDLLLRALPYHDWLRDLPYNGDASTLDPGDERIGTILLGCINYGEIPIDDIEAVPFSIVLVLEEPDNLITRRVRDTGGKGVLRIWRIEGIKISPDDVETVGELVRSSVISQEDVVTCDASEVSTGGARVNYSESLTIDNIKSRSLAGSRELSD